MKKTFVKVKIREATSKKSDREIKRGQQWRRGLQKIMVTHIDHDMDVHYMDIKEGVQGVMSNSALRARYRFEDPWALGAIIAIAVCFNEGGDGRACRSSLSQCGIKSIDDAKSAGAEEFDLKLLKRLFKDG